MNERQHKDRSKNNENSGKSLSNKKYQHDSSSARYVAPSSQLGMKELDTDDEILLNSAGISSSEDEYAAFNKSTVISNRDKNAQLDEDDELLFSPPNKDRTFITDEEQDIQVVDKSLLLDSAGELGLNYIELGKSVQDLSAHLSDLSNVTSESNTWWQDILNNVPYLGGLIEPDSGRMLLNLGDDGYALLTGDIQSIYGYMSEMSQYSANKASFWKFPLLVGLKPSAVREAETIMVGDRSNDLENFIKEAKTGSVSINDREEEAVPLLNWMSLQAGEQSTDVEENANATATNITFAAAISSDTIFTDPQSDGKADRLIDSIESIYSLVKGAPVAEQTRISELLDDELLDIIDDDNRWGLTDNDLQRMVDRVQRLEREWSQKIDRLLIAEKAAENET